MKVDYSEKISQSSEELKKLLSRQKSVSTRQKIQMLYWLKAGVSPSITHVAKLLGVHRTTVQRWFKEYLEIGLEKFLAIKAIPGRPRAIPEEIVASIEEEINQESGGFTSYRELRDWVEKNYNLPVKYSTLHYQVRYRLKAKLKVPRPSSLKKNPDEAIAFKKN